MRFSVLIPLEEHRGHAVRCVRGWAREQLHPREQFEIVVASPRSHPARELDEIRSLLGPQDRLLLLDDDHDMALCARAAEAARGEVLFFTESHCLPEPETLARTDDVVRRHPEWAGFSCRSVPITDNLLSKIEAEWYAKDIEFGMTEHPWRKVLDQCFVVRRSAYFEAGGFDPAFGHFAEWLIAARLHALGLKIGYAPEVRIHHVYIGQFGEWRRFTADFVQGQMSYLAGEPGDPLRSLFDEVPEWSGRLESERAVALRVCRLLLRDLRLSALRRRNWRLLGVWLARAVAGHSAELTHAQLRRVAARLALEADLMRRDQSRAEQHLAACCAAIAAVERTRFVRSWARAHRRNGGSRRPAHGEALASDGTWTPARADGHPGVGFHVGSASDVESNVRWSEPAAYVELPLGAGSYTITLNWLFRPPANGDTRVRFYLNERPLAAENVRIEDDRAELRIDVPESSRATRLGWVCAAHRAGGDSRPLGLPVVSLTWAGGASAAPGHDQRGA